MTFVFVARGPPADFPRRCMRLDATDLTPNRVRSLSPAVVVLGRRAIHGLTPEAVRRAVRGRRVQVVFSPEPPFDGHVEVLALWFGLHFIEFIDDVHLAARLRLLGARGPRVHLEPAAWLGATPPTEDAARLTRALISLDSPRVGKWAATLGMSASTLSRSVRQQLGAPPSHVCARYLLAAYAAERTAGASSAEAADALGFADVSTLLRALCRARARVGEATAGRRDGFERNGQRS